MSCSSAIIGKFQHLYMRMMLAGRMPCSQAVFCASIIARWDAALTISVNVIAKARSLG
jgi:hypothetical protein